jgi:hypothetical protein
MAAIRTANPRKVSVKTASAHTWFQTGSPPQRILRYRSAAIRSCMKTDRSAGSRQQRRRLEIQTMPVLALSTIDRCSHNHQQRTEEKQRDPSLTRRVERAHSASPPLAPTCLPVQRYAFLIRLGTTGEIARRVPHRADIRAMGIRSSSCWAQRSSAHLSSTIVTATLFRRTAAIA